MADDGIVKGTEREQLISDAENYLNAIQTIQSSFNQVSSADHAAAGKFYLRKAADEKYGSFKFDYDDPDPILILSTKGDLLYFDKELNQVSYMSLDDFPLKILLKKKAALNRTWVKKVERRNGLIQMTFQDPKRPEVLTLSFKPVPMTLSSWTIRDAKNIKTTVTLVDPIYDEAVSDKVFDFTRPEKKKIK